MSMPIEKSLYNEKYDIVPPLMCYNRNRRVKRGSLSLIRSLGTNELEEKSCASAVNNDKGGGGNKKNANFPRNLFRYNSSPEMSVMRVDLDKFE